MVEPKELEEPPGGAPRRARSWPPSSRAISDFEDGEKVNIGTNSDIQLAACNCRPASVMSAT
jgi:hypothetical protein